MARLARIVIPGIAHHVTQRGNRRLPVFFSDDDRAHYLNLVADGCRRAGVRCLAWCLMDNHIHLVLVPETSDGLRRGLGEAHRRYTAHVNAREGWRGFLFQGRFASYPMDDAHLIAAIRYVENNPVAAALVDEAAAWRWSSARSHQAGKRVADDPLTDVAALGKHVRNWRSFLKFGAETADTDESDATIEAHMRTGRPLAAPDWIAEMEEQMNRKLAPAKRGPKPKGAWKRKGDAGARFG